MARVAGRLRLVEPRDVLQQAAAALLQRCERRGRESGCDAIARRLPDQGVAFQCLQLRLRSRQRHQLFRIEELVPEAQLIFEPLDLGPRSFCGLACRSGMASMSEKTRQSLLQCGSARAMRCVVIRARGERLSGHGIGRPCGRILAMSASIAPDRCADHRARSAVRRSRPASLQLAPFARSQPPRPARRDQQQQAHLAGTARSA